MQIQQDTNTNTSSTLGAELNTEARTEVRSNTPFKKSLPVEFSDFDLYLFGQGKHLELYSMLGAHPFTHEGESGYRFAVWAPNASSVFVTGEFNNWKPTELALYPVRQTGIWAAFIPGVLPTQLYKFVIQDELGRLQHKADPLSLRSELRPGTASITHALNSESHAYHWQDENWLNTRAARGEHFNEAVSIYEVHAGSWKRHPNAENPFYSYTELAYSLIPYVQEMGFTHIEFMPLAEHPLDQSWGYQTGQYFSPSARFGKPDELRFFIDSCHKAGIGVILDWVPAHFPKDAFALARFDGSALYEHEDPRKGEHPDWGTLIFNYSRYEVKNFLIANALYWLKEFHFDGLRLDAVSSMLYLDYSRKPGEWVANEHGGRENLDAIKFLQELNAEIRNSCPGVMTFAEESTSWPCVSRKSEEDGKSCKNGGLGFSYKWNMGWMHDTLDYMAKPPVHRKWHHDKLTFSLTYAFSENFALPLSHDEVVHGKGSLLNKMPGDQWQKKAGLRLLLAYMWAHPGKKLLFMGGEFGQWKEWNESSELDWGLLNDPSHKGISTLVSDLNRLLKQEPSMHRCDHSWNGFEWALCNEKNTSVYSFLRKSPADQPAAPILWAFNCTPVPRINYPIPLPESVRHMNWNVCLNTDSQYYAGNNTEVRPIKQQSVLRMTIPPLSAVAVVGS